MKKKELDFSSAFRMAEDHIQLERLNGELKTLKAAIWKEAMNANSSFEKLILELPLDIQENQCINLENLIYAIGRIKASAQ